MIKLNWEKMQFKGIFPLCEEGVYVKEEVVYIMNIDL